MSENRLSPGDVAPDFTLTSDDGARLKAIAFRAASTELGQVILSAGNDAPLHLAGTLTLDVQLLAEGR